MFIDDFKNLPLKTRQIIIITLVIVVAGIFMAIFAYMIAKGINLYRRDKYMKKLAKTKILDVERGTFDYETIKRKNEPASIIPDFPPPLSVYISPRDKHYGFPSPVAVPSPFVSHPPVPPLPFAVPPVVVQSPLTIPSTVAAPSHFIVPRPAAAPSQGGSLRPVATHRSIVTSRPAVTPRPVNGPRQAPAPCAAVGPSVVAPLQVRVPRSIQPPRPVATPFVLRPGIPPSPFNITSPPSLAPPRPKYPTSVSKSTMYPSHGRRTDCDLEVSSMDPRVPLNKSYFSTRSREGNPNPSMTTQTQGRTQMVVPADGIFRTPGFATETQVRETMTATTRRHEVFPYPTDIPVVIPNAPSPTELARPRSSIPQTPKKNKVDIPQIGVNTPTYDTNQSLNKEMEDEHNGSMLAYYCQD
ncbi:hypothetical protein AMATHDRAFT_7447 [Amanita thiersii Skay4041]|uniref:Uncharacterized protein n=1 Tax=Amanita thiersii Skay4041 TaxID=703135 RepID=A0A2A9NGI0_9AGAR|nr:hypothetical protein AMATHDRAFT_7447 [Amanita thiersii Skay4041]